ncbi:diguanylate cyclase domain-containing protein [Raoultibacter phocaeensis]|uniref:diguanylate cyclase domain-containing protein n=1 Tax=Raoultibacter phocaeensis TaxID=2479841 RepID=UPI00111844C9|nr:diguanylate cyclase [Raoultibacter phocaeensis]
MYHRTLHIALFGTDCETEKAIRSVACPEHFSFDLNAYKTFDADAFVACDIALIDCVGLSLTDITLPPKKNAARTVFRVEAHRVAELFSSHAKNADDIWLSPMPPELVAFRFAKLIEHEKTSADLALSRQYLDTAIDSIPELVWFKDARGSHLKVNDAFCRTVEKTKEQVEGRGHYYIWDISPEEYSQGEYVCLESEEETMAARATCLFDEQVKTKNGMRQFKTYKSPLFDYDGSVMGTVGIAHDVTDLGNIETELEIFIDSVPYAIVVLDIDETILNINEKAEEYFAVKREQVIGGAFDTWRRLVLGDAVVDSHDFSDSTFFSAEIDGTMKTFEVNQRTIVDVFENETGQLRIYRDVTKERELEERVLRSANTDYLTDLCNRRFLYDQLAAHEGDPVAIAYLDLDDFKGINDRFGHQVGDEVLIEAGRVLTGTYPDNIVVRMGGDEFIVAIFDPPADEVLRERAFDCIEAIGERFSADDFPLKTSGSIGIAVDRSGMLSIDDLIRQSDEALYRAKRAGKSQCCLVEAAR